MSFLLSHVFSSTKLENKRVEHVLPGNGAVGWGKVCQTMYTHVCKFKNDKIKKLIKKTIEALNVSP
jgi:hypothetical protein